VASIFINEVGVNAQHWIDFITKTW